MSPRFILISGCSGGGKSSLLDALAARGFATVLEPGRRIVLEERGKTEGALPWVDLNAFARRAIDMARSDLAAAERMDGPVFFDRGLVDAAVALQFAVGPSYREILDGEFHYRKRVYLAPPWPEIYAADAERRHGFRGAEEEYLRLADAFLDLGYETFVLPRVSVEARVELVLRELGGAGAR